MMEILKDTGMLTSSNLEEIQNVVNSFACPSDLGRIPYKIASGISGFTADQGKQWIVVYSLVSLKLLLPPDHYKCWQTFVHACQLLCSPSIILQNLEEAHSLLVTCCKDIETLYTKKYLIPNMHFPKVYTM